MAASTTLAGAKRVLISAPGKGVDLTVVYGVNHDKLTAAHKIVSNAALRATGWAPRFPSFLSAVEEDPRLVRSIRESITGPA